MILEPLYEESLLSDGIMDADLFGKKYFLKEISSAVGVPPDEINQFKGGRGESEKLAITTLKELFNEKYMLKSEQHLKHVENDIPHIYAHRNTWYDVVAYNDKMHPFFILWNSIINYERNFRYVCLESVQCS